MKKKIILWLITTAMIMIGLPILAVNYVPNDSGMLVSIVCFLIINPLWALSTGIKAGGYPSRLWILPIVLDLIFTAGISFMMTLDSQIFFYLILYIVIAYLSMGASIFRKRKKNR